MAKTPQKIYYDMLTRNVLLSTGLVPNRNDLYPGIKVGQKDNYINVQLVNGNITTPYEDLPYNCTAQWLTDDDYDNANFTTLTTGTSNWTASGHGSNEYYYTTVLSAKPTAVYANSLLLTEGTLGSLGASEWAYGDNDTIGGNRVYVRLSDSTDPDTKTNGYLQYIDTATYTALFIMALGDKFNLTNSWYDEATQTYRDPVITDGEVSFLINSNTTDFITRLAGAAQATATFTEIQFLSSGDADVFEIIKFPFRCINRLLPNPLSPDDPGSPFYNKTESDAKYIVESTTITIADSATSNIILFNKTEADSCIIDMVFSDTVYQNRIRALVMIDASNVITPEVEWYFNDGEQISATYTFDLSGSNVRLNLTNGSGNDLTVNYQVFDLADTGLGSTRIQGIIWKGAWSSLDTYSSGDVVTNNGNMYISSVDNNTNNEPPNASYWEIGASGSPVSITSNRAAVSDGTGSIIASTTTATEIGYISGLSGAIQTQLDAKVDENVAIVAATKTKITYDAKGLVTVGADATTADIADSTDKRYCTDAQKVIIGNTSNTNTGDETQATIKTKLGAASSGVDGYITGSDWTTFSSKASGTHAASHTNGTDDIQTASASQKGLMSSIQAGLVDTATNLNTASTLVMRDASGNFSAGTITANTLTTSIIKPSSDGTSALKITKSDGSTNIMQADTTNNKIVFESNDYVGAENIQFNLHSNNTCLAVRTDSTYVPMIETINMNGSFTSPTPIVNGDVLGTYAFSAQYNSTPGGILVASMIQSKCTETFTSGGAGGSSFWFLVTKNSDGEPTAGLIIGNNGNLKVGYGATDNATAKIHILPGSAIAGTAPLKLTSGTLMSSPEAGAIEFLSDAYYATITTGPTRKTFAFLEAPSFTTNITTPICNTPEIKTDTSTPTDLTITTGAAKTLVLGTVVYNDANVGALTLRTGGTAPGVVEILDNDGDATGIYTIGFAVNEEGSGVIEVPHNYKEGTNLVFHIHWGANDAPAGGTDNVKWQLTYSVSRYNNTFPDSTAATAVEVAYTTQYNWLITDVATITGATGGVDGGNIKIGDQVHFTIKRIAASSDEFGGEALMATIGFHYQVDTLGSRSITAK